MLGPFELLPPLLQPGRQVVLQQQAAVLLPVAPAGGDVLQVEHPGVGGAGGPLQRAAGRGRSRRTRRTVPA